MLDAGTHPSSRAAATISGGRIGRPVRVRTAIEASSHDLGQTCAAEEGGGLVCGDALVVMAAKVRRHCCLGSGVFFATGHGRRSHLVSPTRRAPLLTAPRTVLVAWMLRLAGEVAGMLRPAGAVAAGVRGGASVLGWLAA